MCVIIDASVVGDLFGPDQTEAEKFLFNWLDRGHGRLVMGGKLREELLLNGRFKKWAAQAVLAGRVFQFADDQITENAQAIERGGLCRSDDPHVLALARVSGARLLYSNDGDLQADFVKPNILGRTRRGKIYAKDKEYRDRVRDAHKRLLRQQDLCPRLAG